MERSRLRALNVVLRDILASGAPFDIKDVIRELSGTCLEVDVRDALHRLSRRGIVKISGQCTHTAVWLTTKGMKK